MAKNDALLSEFRRLSRKATACALTGMLFVVLVWSVMMVLPSPRDASAQTEATSPRSGERFSSEGAKRLRQWRTFMAQQSLPRKGCFSAVYPSTDWSAALCTPAPEIPTTPKRGTRPLVVGNTNDISAQAPSGFISTAIGSFDSVNVTSESSPIANSGSAVANAYTLQVNTNFFASSVCSGAGNPTQCRGWEQFVFWNDGSSGGAFIQYWLIRYNHSCPSGQSWNQFSFTGSTDIYCWKDDSGGSVAVPNQPITNLAQLSLSGAVSATSDSVTMFVGTTAYARAGDNAVNAASGWTTAEFNVFGAGGSSAGGGEATFNSGASITPRTRIFYGGRTAPTCVAQGFTGETNNLSFGPSAPTPSQPGPAVIFNEISAGGASSNCAAATTVGDTHLFTNRGLFYDFQASGDFLLAKVDPGFVVQARQVSGAPIWPDASVNNAIATKMGKTQVAVCLEPTRLYVDGTIEELGETPFSAPHGVTVIRRGNIYYITGPRGDSVRVTVNAGWIDALVGFGRWPVKVTGLLANAENNVNKVATRDGTVFTSPFAFSDLYHRYGDTWRVTSKESLLSVCGKKVEQGNPKQLFFAQDLDRKTFDRTRAVCVAAGVEGRALLDACTLDVAVIDNNTAARVFVTAQHPVAVGNS